MQQLKVGATIINQSAEYIQGYLKKKYVLQHLDQKQYTVVYDKKFEHSYRLLRENYNEPISSSTLHSNNWTVLKVPKARMSFKALLWKCQTLRLVWK